VGADRREQRNLLRERSDVHRAVRSRRLRPFLVSRPDPTDPQSGSPDADTTGMDDSFAYRTSLPSDPRVDPWLVKGAVVVVVLAIGVGLFARWVVASERASFARGHHRVMPSMVVVGQGGGSEDPAGTDDEAVEATRIAFAAARVALAGTGSFLAADPARLSALQPGFTFVDGPSTASTIVSVAADRRLWAAAVLGPSGTCFWIRAHRDDTVEMGTSSTCTGASVLREAGIGEGDRAGQ